MAVLDAAFSVSGIVFHEEPEAGGYAAAGAFADKDGGHAAIGENTSHNALQNEVVDEVLHSEVRVLLGRDAES